MVPAATEDAMADEQRYLAVAGKAWALNALEVPPYKTMRVTPVVAKRAVYVERVIRVDDEPFAVFHDPKTPRNGGTWFAQYLPDEDWPE